MNYDELSLAAIQWVTWLSIAAGGIAALGTLIFGLISMTALSAADSSKTAIERFALGFVSRKRYMVPVTLTLLTSFYGAVSSMDYRVTISDTIANGALVLRIPPKALVAGDGAPLRVMENEAMFLHVFDVDVRPLVSVLSSRGYLEPSQANTNDLIEAIKRLEREA